MHSLRAAYRVGAILFFSSLAGCVPAPGIDPGSGNSAVTGGVTAADTLGMSLRPLPANEASALPGILAVTAEANRAVVFVNPLSGRAFAYAGVGWAPRAIVASRDGRSLYVANSQGDRFGLGAVSIISPDERREVERIDLSPNGGLRGMALASSGTFLYIASETRRCVLEFNVISRNVDRAFTLPRGAPSQLALNATDTQLFVTDPNSGVVWAVDLTTGRFLEGRAGRRPEGIGLAPDGQTLWVTNADDGTVSVLDPNTMVTLATVIAGRSPVAVAFTRDGQKALVVVAGESSVAVFDVAARARLQSLAVAGYPSAIAVEPSGQRAYVTSTRDDVINAIDLAAMTVQASPPIGRVPMGIVWVPRR